MESQVQEKLAPGASFVAASQVREGAEDARINKATTDALVGHYEDAQLEALKLALLFAALLVLASFPATRNLPSRRFEELEAERAPPGDAAAVSETAAQGV